MAARYFAGVPPRQDKTDKSTIVSAEDYLNITHIIDNNRVTESTQNAQRLHELSQKRVSNWQNTAKNQRNARLHAREERLKAEEDARLAQDIIWAQEAQARKNAIIARAHNMQLSQTEAVRMVNSKLLMEAQLRERELQIAHKVKSGKARKVADSGFIVQGEIIREREDRAREEKEASKAKAVLATAAYQKEQALKNKANRVEKRHAALAETPVVQALDAAYVEHMRRKLAQNQQQQKAIQAELIAAKEQALNCKKETLNISKDMDKNAQKWRERKDAQDQALVEASKRKWITASSLADNLVRQREAEEEIRTARLNTSMVNAQMEQEAKFLAEHQRKEAKSSDFYASQRASHEANKITRHEAAEKEVREKQAKLQESLQKRAEYDLELIAKRAKADAAIQSIQDYRHNQIALKRAEEMSNAKSAAAAFGENVASQLRDTQALEDYVKGLHLDPVVCQQAGSGIPNVQLYGSRIIEAERKRILR